MVEYGPTRNTRGRARWLAAAALLTPWLALPVRAQEAPPESAPATAAPATTAPATTAPAEPAPETELMPIAADRAATEPAEVTSEPPAEPAAPEIALDEPPVPPAPPETPPQSLLAPTNPPRLPDAPLPATGTGLSDLQLSVTELTAGVTAAAVAVPTTLALASWLGSVPSNLYLALLPALLLTVALPPAAVVGAEWLLAEWLAPGNETPWWALGATALVQVGTVTTAMLAGVSTRQQTAALVLAAVEVAVLPAVATAVLRATRSPLDQGDRIDDDVNDGGAP
ncbi:MAG: hypothetical protein JXR83_15180 [Deltaproteobacteria bacterium]|nr:hypothetical protein [Deltaproteobacteria bacterium]